MVVLGRANTCGAVPSRCMSMLRARYTSVGTCTRRTQRARHMSHGLWSRGPKSRWRRARVHVRAPTTMCSVGHECTRRRTTVPPLPHGAVAMPPSSLRRHRASQHNAPQPTTARPRDLAHPRLTHRARRRRPDPRLLHRPHATAPPRAPPPLLRHTHTDTVAAHTTPPCRATDWPRQSYRARRIRHSRTRRVAAQSCNRAHRALHIIPTSRRLRAQRRSARQPSAPRRARVTARLPPACPTITEQKDPSPTPRAPRVAQVSVLRRAAP